MLRALFAIAASSLGVTAAPAAAKVIDATPGGFLIRHEATIAAAPLTQRHTQRRPNTASAGRVAAHLVAIALLLPGLVVAAALLALGHVTAQRGLLAFLTAVLEVLLLGLPWVLVVLALLIAVAAFGFSTKHRWAAAICVGGIAIGSAVVLLWIGRPESSTGNEAILVPGALALAIAIWLAVTEWPASKDY